MPKWTVPLSSVHPVSLVGRKAAALSRLAEQGFPVPTGVCVTTQAFVHAVATAAPELRLPDGLLEELTGAFPLHTPLAVRSSAVMEDTPQASRAGLYATFLNVNGPAALGEAVLDCWRSYFSASTPPGEGGMAVLVQPMLDAECAGVCFTLDPVRLRPDLLLVVSAWGLAAGVVSGSVPSDTARLRRGDLGIEDHIVADKHSAVRPALTGAGVAPVSVPDELRGSACLPESWLERIGQFGLAAEQIFGAPQDLEWTVANGQLWILQSRPITALPAETRAAARFPIIWENEAEPRQYWWLWRAHDSAGCPLLPAELAFNRFSSRGSLEAVKLGGSADTRWLKYIHGRVYMARASSPYTPGHVRVYGAANRELYERLAQQNITLWEYWGPEIISATARLASFDGRAADGPGLADHLENVIATATRHWMIHTLGPRPSRAPALLEVSVRLTGLPPEDAAAELPFLLAGAESIQTRLIEALYHLASLALAAPEAAKTIALAYQAGGLLEVPDGSAFAPEMEAFASAFSRLMAEYGDRLCYRPVPGYPVHLPLPWREVPEHVWEMVAGYLPLARQGGPGPRETHSGALRAVHERIEALCAGARDPALVEEFRRKLAYARRNAAGLDEHNHYIDQVSEGQYIQALLYAGRWLAGCGCLPGYFDVFWLYPDEVLAALREPSSGLEALLPARRAQFAEWQALLAPACLGLPNAQLPQRPAHPQGPPDRSTRPTDPSVGQLTGEPASRGRATGRARLVTTDAPPLDILPGDVLVARSAGPLLIAYLPTAAALVLDTGSPGDHFAITAREFGLPCVCATGCATRLIPEGARVTVDAHTGLVTWA